MCKSLQCQYQDIVKHYTLLEVNEGIYFIYHMYINTEKYSLNTPISRYQIQD